jgi:hypothetical protein
MLKDGLIEKNLRRDGYAVVGKIGEDDLTKLIEFHRGMKGGATDFYYSLLNNSYSANKEILDTQKAILKPFFEAHFSNYRTLTESYLIKPAQTENELLLHQDWCYTDEDKYQAYNVWIPLTDVNEENGALFFLKGSHLWFNNKRSGSLHTARISSQNGPIARNIVTAQMQKGEVILFNPAAFHGSWPNRSLQDRVIATTTVMDIDAPFLYYQKASEDEIDVFHLDDERFIRDLAPLTRGEGPSSGTKERMSYKHLIVTEEMILKKLSDQDQ